MQKYQSTTPDWLYHKPNIDPDVLTIIKKELLKLSVADKPNNLVDYTSTFVAANRELTYKLCPTLIQQLDKFNLLKDFCFVAFISVIGQKEFPPHVDVGTDVGLNIPLMNCEDTYTVWYDAKIVDKELPNYAIGSEIAHMARVCDPRNVVEIGRCDSSHSYWINTNIPHRPETHHSKFRLAASIRFFPDPLGPNGELWPHLIKE
jgi:hypothetical protein